MPLQDRFLMDFEGIEPAGHKETLVDETGQPDFRNDASAFLTPNLGTNVNGQFNAASGDILVNQNQDPEGQVNTTLHEYGHKLFRDLEISTRDTDRQVVDSFKQMFNMLKRRGDPQSQAILNAFKRGELEHPNGGLSEAFAQAFEIDGVDGLRDNPLMKQFLNGTFTGQTPRDTRDLIQGQFNLQVQ